MSEKLGDIKAHAGKWRALEAASRAMVAREDAYPWASDIADARLGRTASKFMELASPAAVLALIAELEFLHAEAERLRMQLAACGVVALANTPETAALNRSMHPDYMSASCQDVMRAVDREMTLRAEVEQLKAEAQAAPEDYPNLLRINREAAAHAEAESDKLRDALQHIVKTCQRSRTSTRRLRWLEQRAQWALDGRPYDDQAFDLPKDATGSQEKLRLEVRSLREDAERLDYLIREAATIHEFTMPSGPRYRVVWPWMGEQQAELFEDPRVAIDAARAAGENAC